MHCYCQNDLEDWNDAQVLMHLSKHREDVCRNGCLVFCQLHLHCTVQGVHSASEIGEFSVYVYYEIFSG